MVVMVTVNTVAVGRAAAAGHQVTNKTTIPIRTRTESPTPKSTPAMTTRTLSPTRSRTPKRVESARHGVLPLVQSIVDMVVDMWEEVRITARVAWGKTKGYTGMRGTQTTTFRMDSREIGTQTDPQILESDWYPGCNKHNVIVFRHVACGNWRHATSIQVIERGVA